MIGALCPDEAPLLGLVSLMAPAIAMGNRVVLVASEPFPLAATDFYQVLDTSDVPAGVVNILTGDTADLAPHLAGHMDVDAVWCFSSADISRRDRARERRQPQADLGRMTAAPATGPSDRGRTLPGAGDRGQDGLGALRRVARRGPLGAVAGSGRCGGPGARFLARPGRPSEGGPPGRHGQCPQGQVEPRRATPSIPVARVERRQGACPGRSCPAGPGTVSRGRGPGGIRLCDAVRQA